MRKIIVTLILLASTPAMAQVSVWNGSDGQPLATGIQAGNNTFYYGESGQPLGTAIQAGRTTWYYDANGNPAASRIDLGNDD